MPHPTYRLKAATLQGSLRPWGFLLAAGLLLILGCVSVAQPQGWAAPVLATVGSGPTPDTIFLGTSKGKLLALALPQKGGEPQVRWTFPADKDKSLVSLYGTPILHEGTLYVGAFDGKLYALEASSGEALWNPPLALDGPVVGTPLLHQGTILVGTARGSLYRVAARSGEVRWRATLAQEPLWSGIVAAEDTAYVGSLDHRLYAVALGEGTVRWRFQAKGGIAATPTLGAGRLYVGSFDRHLYALDLATKGPRWSFGAQNWFWAQPLLLGPSLYVGSLDGRLYALDAATGQQRWSFTTGGPIVAPAVAHNNEVIIASADGRVYALTPQGTKRWEYDAAAEGHPRFPIQAPLALYQGTLYAVTVRDTVLALDASTGKKLWEYPKP